MLHWLLKLHFFYDLLPLLQKLHNLYNTYDYETVCEIGV